MPSVLKNMIKKPQAVMLILPGANYTVRDTTQIRKNNSHALCRCGIAMLSDTAFLITVETPLKPTEVMIVSHVSRSLSKTGSETGAQVGFHSDCRRVVITRSVHSSEATFQTPLTRAHTSRSLSLLRKECTPPRQCLCHILLSQRYHNLSEISSKK